MKITTLITAASLALCAATAMADETRNTEGRKLAQLSFASVDLDGKGYVHQGDMEIFRDKIFVSMDYDDDGKLTRDEFLAWDIGFEDIAEGDQKLAYLTAMKVVYAFWDRNGDGELTQSEHRRALAADFARADLNDNSVLEEQEYLRGLTVFIAARAALKPND